MTTAAMLVERMMAPHPPQFIKPALAQYCPPYPSNSVETRVACSSGPTNYDFFGNAVLNPTWMDAGNVCWDASKPPYLRPGNRAAAQDAMSTACQCAEDVLAPAFGPSQSFHFAGYEPSAHSSSSPPHKQATLATKLFPLPALNRNVRPVVPHALDEIRQYTLELTSDDDEFLDSDWRWKEALRNQTRSCLLRELVDEAEKGIPILAPRPIHYVHIPFLEPKPSVRTTQKYLHLRYRVNPPPSLDVAQCQKYAEKEREIFQQQVEIVTDSDSESDSSEEFFECGSDDHAIVIRAGDDVEGYADAAQKRQLLITSDDEDLVLSHKMTNYIPVLLSPSHNVLSIAAADEHSSDEDSDGHHADDSDGASVDGRSDTSSPGLTTQIQKGKVLSREKFRWGRAGNFHASRARVFRW